jgi:outer membrane protein OmpA-like peptidoglycan-associated protein
MEFQSGPEALLRPVEITAVQVAPLDSYVTFNAPGAIAAFSKWSVEVRDEKGQLQTFGPYMGEKVSIPGKSILGTRPQGDYKMTMVGQAKNGKVVRQDANVHMVLWTPPATEAGMRYSILFEFNDSNANTTYDKYLTDIVTARIPVGGKVIIHGHTDIIGAEANNVTLSIARANEAKSIIESALAKAGRKDVTFEVYGFGEDESMAPFENTYPEERFYNRTVIIDIIPGRK